MSTIRHPVQNHFWWYAAAAAVVMAALLAVLMATVLANSGSAGSSGGDSTMPAGQTQGYHGNEYATQCFAGRHSGSIELAHQHCPISTP